MLASAAQSLGNRPQTKARPLAIDVFAMPNLENEHGYPFVLKMADEAVVAYTVTPQTLPFTTKRPAPLARVFRRRQSVTQKSLNRSLRGAIELCDLLLGCAGDLNSPRHG
jgi:hypothetical protein